MSPASALTLALALASPPTPTPSSTPLRRCMPRSRRARPRATWAAPPASALTLALASPHTPRHPVLYPTQALRAELREAKAEIAAGPPPPPPPPPRFSPNPRPRQPTHPDPVLYRYPTPALRAQELQKQKDGTCVARGAPPLRRPAARRWRGRAAAAAAFALREGKRLRGRPGAPGLRR